MKKTIILFLLFTIYQSVTASNNYTNESVLSTGNWIKLATTVQGIHKITYKQLSSWGITTPENVAIYSNGGYMLPKMNNEYYPDDLEKISVIHSKDNNGDNCVFFYSTGSVSWKYSETKSIFVHTLNLYSDKTYFFLTDNKTKSEAPPIKPQPDGTSTISVNYFDNFQLYEEENVNIGETGRIWYSDPINPSYSKTKEFELSNFLPNQKATLTIAAGAASSSSSQYQININNINTDIFPFGKTSKDEVHPEEKYFEITPSSPLKIKLTYETTASSGDSWLDFITLNYKANLKLEGNQLAFRNIVAKNNNVIAYQIEASTSNPILWDISDPIHPTSVSFSKTSTKITFSDNGLTIPNYVLFDTEKTGFPTPQFVENIENQNIHGLPSYDMIIVSHPTFMPASEKLAEFHRQNDDMKVLVLTPDEIYNEFSSGLPDVSGIRNMVRMFYTRGIDTDTPLQYLLLMGDGSYNNRNFDGTYSNYLPTYQSDFISISTPSFVSDDFFVLLDENEGEMNGYIDVGVGRIPCQTLKDAEIVVDKTISYTKPESLGEWRNVMAFLADDEGDGFMSDTESLINIVNSNYTGIYTDKIYFDAYNQVSTSGGQLYPDVNKAINQRVDEGALLINYMGHANEFSMAHEDVMTIGDVNSWSNEKKLPIFVTATCEFSRFDFSKTSIGEKILFHPAGGGVALFSTTRLVYSGPNTTLSQNFYRNAFKHDKDGNLLRLGDIMRLAKNATKSGYNKRSFTLLGDPALRLAFPKYKVITKTINGIDISDSITIGALDKVTVTGQVVDVDNNVLTNFNGDINIIVYDKASNVQTLGNDGYAKFEYTVQNNIVYKGLSTVTNGEFDFSFVVPKDIAYNVDKGRILYYTTNDLEDGTGSSNDFIITGSSKNPVIDNDPPEMKAYINNENFKDYDKVSSSSLLLVNLYDESGINTAGTGIGHNITAVIDSDYLNQIVLNDFYVAEVNTYQRGKVLYPINDLDVGVHKILIKAWDIQNNSITEEIYFTVEDGFKILSVSNAPNPVQFYTVFSIEHNLPGDSFDTTVELFDLRGKKIDEIDKTVGSYRTTEATVRWDISNTNFPLNNNSYIIYRITLKNQEGLTAIGTGKLIINN